MNKRIRARGEAARQAQDNDRALKLRIPAQAAYVQAELAQLAEYLWPRIEVVRVKPANSGIFTKRTPPGVHLVYDQVLLRDGSVMSWDSTPVDIAWALSDDPTAPTLFKYSLWSVGPGERDVACRQRIHPDYDTPTLAVHDWCLELAERAIGAGA